MNKNLKNNLIKFGKKFSFLGAVLGASSAASAQDVYQCMPCPFGTVSNGGTETACADVLMAPAQSTIKTNRTNVEAGWYRVSLYSANGSSGSDKTCSGTNRDGGIVGCSGATGGVGGRWSYVFFVPTSGYSFAFKNSGKTLEVLTNSNALFRKFTVNTASRGSDGVCTKDSGGYATCGSASRGSDASVKYENITPFELAHSLGAYSSNSYPTSLLYTGTDVSIVVQKL